LIANNYREKWSMATAAFPHKMKAHGFEEVKNPNSEEDILPGYFYRDDGYKLWQALTTYITTSINVIYKSDEGVVNDSQLQQVWLDFKQKDAANVAGDIPAWNSKQALVDFLVLAIFIGSAEHSAVNFGQLDFYAFIPNRPLLMRKPMPDDPAQVTLDYIMQALPDYDQAESTILTASTLSMMNDGTLYDWAEKANDDTPAKLRFLADLAQISKDVVARTLATSVKWPYLNPKDRMARSIAI